MTGIFLVHSRWVCRSVEMKGSSHDFLSHNYLNKREIFDFVILFTLTHDAFHIIGPNSEPEACGTMTS